MCQQPWFFFKDVRKISPQTLRCGKMWGDDIFFVVFVYVKNVSFNYIGTVW